MQDLDGCAHTAAACASPEGFTCDCFDGYRLDMTRMSTALVRGSGGARASTEGWR